MIENRKQIDRWLDNPPLGGSTVRPETAQKTIRLNTAPHPY